MLSNWLFPERINMVEHVSDWQSAVRLAAAPLLDDGTITTGYLDAIFHAHEELGPFYVLAPGLAMPHARPEQGALDNGLSLLHIRQGVVFEADENDPIYVVILLSARNGDEHINMITALAELFCDEHKLHSLLNAQSRADVTALINSK